MIEIRGVPIDTTLRARILTRMTRVLERLRVAPLEAQVTFSDENGPKGGVAVRCALSVRVPRRPILRVEDVAETPRLAFDAVFPTLERRLLQDRERGRDGQRHPKKYYVARRATGLGDAKGASGAGAGGPRPPGAE